MVSDAGSSVVLKNVSMGMDDDDDGPTDVEFQQVLQHIKSPLTGKNVMIPLTTCAFFEGKLQPPVRNDNDEKSEVLCMNLGQGYMAEMTRHKGQELLQRRIQTYQQLIQKTKPNIINNNNKSTTMTSTTKQVTPKSIMKPTKSSSSFQIKKGFLRSNSTQTKNKKTTTKNKVETTTSTKQKNDKKNHIVGIHPSNNTHSHKIINPDTIGEYSTTSALPYIEIREEYDENGNEITSKAIDMSQELKTLKQNIQQQKATTNEKNKETILSTLVDHLNIGETNRMSDTTSQPTNELNNNNNNDDDDDHDEDNDHKTSEETYDTISKRLDELIQMEEEAETKKKNPNQKSSSQGWNKGFLNKKKNSNKTSRKDKEEGIKQTSTTTTKNETNKKSSSTTKKISIREGERITKNLHHYNIVYQHISNLFLHLYYNPCRASRCCANRDSFFVCGGCTFSFEVGLDNSLSSILS